MSRATRDVAVAPIANDPLSGLSHPSSFTVSADQLIVHDNVTGLEWQRTVDAGNYTWAAAKTYCDNLVYAGACDWRLPQRIELLSIIDYTRFNPSVEPTLFAGTPKKTFWSATGALGGTGGWYLDFVGGAMNFSPVTTPYYVRCVRSGPAAPVTRYTMTAQTVLDTATGLTWERSVSVSTYTFAQATAYCSGLTDAGGGWRTPSIQEFESIVDTSHENPAIEPVAFPATPNAIFWSGSPLANDANQGWTINFNAGYTFRTTSTNSNTLLPPDMPMIGDPSPGVVHTFRVKSTALRVRCVR